MCIDLPWMDYIKYIPGAPLKTGPFFKVCNSCIRWRRKVIHISNCSVLYLVVHVLNFVTVKYFCCIGLVKQYYTKNNGSPIIFRSHVTANSLFFNVLDFIKAERSIYQNVQYYVRSKNCVLNFTAVCIFCTMQWNDMTLKMTISVHVPPVSRVSDTMEALPRAARTPIWSTSYSQSFTTNVFR